LAGGANAEAACLGDRERYRRIPRRPSSLKCLGLDWDDVLVDVNDAIEPSVWNFKSKKVGRLLQYPMSFCEGTILLFARPQ